MATHFIYSPAGFESPLKVIISIEIAEEARSFDPDREIQWQCNAEGSVEAIMLWADEMFECSDPFGNPHFDFQLSI